MEVQYMESAPPTSAQAVLGIIIKLHDAGCSPEEITTRLLSGGADTTAFRVQGLVEIVIACAAKWKLEFERVLDGETPRNQGG